MDSVKRKVYLDLFASPSTLLPMVGGLTALLASWAVGGNAVFNFAGVAGILGGAGMFATRLIFGLENLTQRAYDYVLQKQQQQKDSALEELAKRLLTDQDPRTEVCLTQLRHLYDTLAKDIREGKITLAAHDVMDGVDRMFHLCVEHLQRSYELYALSQQQQGISRQTTMRQREELIGEVIQSVQYLENVVQQLNSVASRRSKSELSQLRAELDETISVARRAEERTEAIGRQRDVSEHEFN
ncbi:MAG: hypothetical protein R3E01_21420 [Pirellulaceae bacterium]|nr:hypothetical protein [Planctomycetales bacterium]